MKFNLIDLESWPRKSHYELYKQTRQTFNLTKNIDITKLLSFIKKEDYKFYPTFTYIVSKAINEITEFKIRLDDEGGLGYWDYVSPTYTIFHEDDKTFSCIYTEYNENFSLFHEDMLADINGYKSIKGICPKPSPKNCFHVSAVPWLSYTSLSMETYYDYLAPMTFWGKYTKVQGRVELPFTVQANHAVADGYHASMLINSIHEMASDFEVLSKDKEAEK